MRTVTCALMIILCFLLTSCGKQGTDGMELALQIRTKFIETNEYTMQAEVVADYGETVYEYTIKYTCRKDGESEILVLAPENIAGLRATVRAEEMILNYEGASLETGKLSGDGLTPIDALPSMLGAWQEAIIADTGKETLDEADTLRVCFEISGAGGEKIEQCAWFEPESFVPIRAETSVDGYTVIRCSFSEFEFK